MFLHHRTSVNVERLKADNQKFGFSAVDLHRRSELGDIPTLTGGMRYLGSSNEHMLEQDETLCIPRSITRPKRFLFFFLAFPDGHELTYSLYNSRRVKI